MARADLDTPVRRSTSAATAEIDGQLVALDINKGVCYGLNEVGTRIWGLIDAPMSARAISEILVDEYDVDQATAEEQTLDLILELLATELAISA